ncbi:VTT domain-containing protein [Saxibacter everestensis]|uniref:VTT domain-containing protein n=1 Tax=Saxibacter everestensis TaxID=2909229 RepID=A0ABY8QRA4_9MICO|nr:VTT domain-containing protein [Brevibacteriaceae bacterium ZFBP1038]
MQALTDVVLNAADSLWVYPLSLLFVTVSALIPPVPSTSLFVGLGALSAAADVPSAWLLAVTMAAGSLLGDVISFYLASRYDPSAWRLLRGRRRQEALDKAKEQLAERAPTYIISSRFIPLGRLTVNVTAAMSDMRRERFLFYSAVAAVFWATYSVGIGSLAGVWFKRYPAFGVLIAVAISIVLGYGIGKAVSWYLDRHQARQAERRSAA